MPKIEEPLPEKKYYIMPLPDGREIHVTDNEDLWHLLAGEGKIVFSENELKRFVAASGRMEREQRLDAILKIVDAKETFPGAYIKRGEAFACDK